VEVERKYTFVLPNVGVNHGGNGGQRPPEFVVGALLQIAHPDFQKNTAQNLPQHTISSKRFNIFFWEGAHPLPGPFPADPSPHPQPGLLDLHLLPP